MVEGSEIVVDSREPWEKVFGHLDDLGSDCHRLEALDNGADFVVRNGGDELAIQRKQIDDFVSSLGKLKETLRQLRTHYQWAGLLIEDDWTLAGGTIAQRRGSTIHQTIPVSSLHNFVFSQQLRGTLFFKTSGMKETCRFLLSVHDYMEDPIGGEGNAETPVMLLTSLPKIGPSKAGRLVDYYGSVGGALTSIDHWDDVKGVGPSTVEAIEEFLYES